MNESTKCEMILLSLSVVLSVYSVYSETLPNTNYNELNLLGNVLNRLQEILNSNNGSKLSPPCEAHLKHYRKGLISGKEEDRWALQMFDARSKIPTGLMRANLVDLGSFDECIDVEAKLPQSDKIYGQYCLGIIPFPISTTQTKHSKQSDRNPLWRLPTPESRTMGPEGELGMQLATCAPHSCSASDMEEIYFRVGMVFYEELCQTNQVSQPELDGGSTATIAFLGVIMLIMVLSTVYDSFLHYYEKKVSYSILIAFSVLTNGKKILATSAQNQISCLHGIRVITTMWVILAHRFTIQASFPLNNYLDATNWQMKQENMYIMGASVSVDTFFLMSGLVIAYSYMGAVTKGVKFNIIMFYVHRYLRLTPVLAVIMVIHITLFKHLGSGPLWPYMVQREITSNCEKYWWKTMLYIQNYGNQEGTCVPQSWYLSVDMQLFILSPLLLLPLGKWPKVTLSATTFLTFCSILTCFLIGWFFELNHSMMGNGMGEKLQKYMQFYYIATPTRAAPWFIGILLGYAIFVFRRRDTKLIINKKLILLGWVISIATLCTCLFSGHDLIKEDEYSRVANSFHLALVRPAWAIALTFIIFACVFEYGGPINWFLSLPMFQILSKFTFTLYLTHYLIIYLTTGQMRTSPAFSSIQMLYVFWGDFIFTLVVAVLFTLAFESPIITIEKILFGGSKKKKITPPPSQESKSKPAETA